MKRHRPAKILAARLLRRCGLKFKTVAWLLRVSISQARRWCSPPEVKEPTLAEQRADDPLSTRYKCPSCDHALRVSRFSESRVLLYCDHGPCESKVSNDGWIGTSEDDAFKGLSNLIQNEHAESPI